MNLDVIKGFLIGIISPVILFVCITVFYLEYDLISFINNKINAVNLPKIISLSLLINLALFFLKIKFNKDDQSRGILFSTFLFGAIIIILKFL